MQSMSFSATTAAQAHNEIKVLKFNVHCEKATATEIKGARNAYVAALCHYLKRRPDPSLFIITPFKSNFLLEAEPDSSRDPEAILPSYPRPD